MTSIQLPYISQYWLFNFSLFFNFIITTSVFTDVIEQREQQDSSVRKYLPAQFYSIVAQVLPCEYKYMDEHFGHRLRGAFPICLTFGFD